MIVVDSSVWIDVFTDRASPQARLLHTLDPLDVLILDLVAVEVLQGARSERHARLIEQEFAVFGITAIGSPQLALIAAANYRFLRARGITIRKTIDLIIGTFCIEHGHALLQADRDFRPMAEHLGLRLA